MEGPWEDTDRQNALLTNKQRTKLMDGDLSRKERMNIRDRLKSTMYDFVLLNEYARDREKLQVVYSDFDIDWTNKDDEQLRNQLKAKLGDENPRFTDDIAKGILSQMQFLEDVTFFPEKYEAAQTGLAISEIDFFEAFQEAVNTVENSGEDGLTFEEFLDFEESLENMVAGEMGYEDGLPVGLRDLLAEPSAEDD